jgi:hypothetical protein
MALVMIQLLREPYPVDPFLVYAAFFDNSRCFDFLLRPYGEYKPQHLLAMIRDEVTWQLVSALLGHTCDEIFTSEEVASHPLLSRALAYFPVAKFHKH